MEMSKAFGRDMHLGQEPLNAAVAYIEQTKSTWQKIYAERSHLRTQLCSSIEEALQGLDDQIAVLEAERQRIETELANFRSRREKKVQNIHTIEESILADLQRRWCTEASALMGRLQITLIPANKGDFPSPPPPLPTEEEEVRNEGIVLVIHKEESAAQHTAPATTFEQRMPVPLHTAPTLRRRTRSRQSSDDCLIGKCYDTVPKRASSPSTVLSVDHQPLAKGGTTTVSIPTTNCDTFGGGITAWCPSMVWAGVVNFMTEVRLTTSEAVEELIV